TDPAYPTLSILPLSDEEIDSTTSMGYIQIGDGAAFETRGIRTEFGQGTVLQAADQFILAIIMQAWEDRPIYFAATTNSHGRLGLDRYTARQGVAFKLMTVDELMDPGIIPFSPADRYAPMFGNAIDL